MVLNENDFWGNYSLLNNSDELNTSNSRNLKNTNRDVYNCGGYALGTFNWFLPYSKRNRYKYHGKFKKNSSKLVNYMITLFNGRLRNIKSIDDLKENENAIAFRCANEDFHFMIRKDNKIWYHKRGSFSKIERISKEDVFNDGWKSNGLNYDGKLYLLALKK